MIFIGTDGGIYRWFEGSGWAIFHSLQDRAIVGLASPSAGVLVALDDRGGVYETVNNGQDWRTIPTPEGSGPPTAVAAWGTPATIVLATRQPALYRRDLGAPIPRALEPKVIRPGLGPALFGRARTLAEGATARIVPRSRPARVDPRIARQAGWTRLGLTTGKGADIRALAAGTSTPTPWFAAIRGAGLWRSRDAGANWWQCPGLPSEVLAVRTPPERPGSVFAATANGCWVSNDDGLTWEDRSSGLEGHRYLNAIEVKPGAPDVLLAGAAPQGPSALAGGSTKGLAFSLFESSNGGKTWTIVRRGNPEVVANDMIADIRYDPTSPDNVVMALASGELWVTRNGGAYWSPINRQTRAARVLCAIA